MKSKIFASLTFALFAVFLSLTLVSAAPNDGDLTLAEITAPIEVNHDDGTLTVVFEVANGGASDHAVLWTSSPSVGTWEFSPTLPSDIIAGTTTEITGTLTFPEHESATITDTIQVTSGVLSPGELVVSIDITEAPELSLTPTTLTTGATSATMTLTNEGNTELTGIEFTFSTLSGVILTADPVPTLEAGEEAVITINAVISSDFSLDSSSVTVIATASDLTEITAVLTLENEFCSAGEIGDLDIKVDIKNDGRGKDDEWYLLDTLIVEVDVDNDGDDKINDIVIEWSLVNQDTGEVIDDDDLNDFNLKDGKDKTLIFEIELDPDDFDADDIGDDFILLVKAFGDDSDVGEDLECVSTSETAELFGDDFMIVDVDAINLPDSLQAGDLLEVRAKIWNVGSESQDEVSIRVQVVEFGYDQTFEVGDIDELDDEAFSFSLEIPSNTQNGIYAIRFDVFDEDGDFFEDDDDDDSTFLKLFTVVGGTSSQASVGIVAGLESNAVAGEELVIRTTITNTGDETTTYNVIAEDFRSWSSLESIQPPTFTLEAGESRDVTITLMPNDDASGTEEFTVQVVYSGIITEQAIEVEFQSGRGAGFTGGAIGASIQENWFIWLVALINIILVILIIVVAVRMASR